MLTDVVDRTDVGVVQGGSCPCLALEAAESLGIASDFIGKKLQSYETVEPGVLALVDHAHPAAAQLSDDVVMGNGPADQGIGAVLLVFAPPASHGPRGHLYRRT